MTLRRYTRAFLTALQMTLRGEKLPERPLPPIVAWTTEYARLADHLYKAVESSGLDKTALKTMKIRLDGRDLSLESVLTTIRYHAAQEYPALLKHELSPQTVNAVYAGLFNDRYWLTRLGETPALQSPSIQTALERLTTHMDAVPTLDAAIS